ALREGARRVPAGAGAVMAAGIQAALQLADHRVGPDRTRSRTLGCARKTPIAALASSLLAAEASPAADQPRQGRLETQQPRVERELAAVILLVGDAMMEPRELGAGLAIEALEELTERHLAGGAKPALPVAELRPQQRHQLAAGGGAMGRPRVG